MDDGTASRLIASGAAEKANNALWILAVKDRSLLDRLSLAWQDLGMLYGRDLPAPFDTMYADLYERVTEYGLGAPNSIYDNTLTRLDSDDLEHMAGLVLQFATKVAAAIETLRP